MFSSVFHHFFIWFLDWNEVITILIDSRIIYDFHFFCLEITNIWWKNEDNSRTFWFWNFNNYYLSYLQLKHINIFINFQFQKKYIFKMIVHINDNWEQFLNLIGEVWVGSHRNFKKSFWICKNTCWTEPLMFRTP